MHNEMQVQSILALNTDHWSRPRPVRY